MTWSRSSLKAMPINVLTSKRLLPIFIISLATDPLFTAAYTGVNVGLLIISADDQGLNSSQNEQDNRYYAKAAKAPMVEPSNSQEAKDMVKAAMEISESFDVPVLMRTTTRVNHIKTLVEAGEKLQQTKKPYVKNLQKYDAVPAVSKRLHVELEKKMIRLEEFSNETELNYIEWNYKKTGVISSGIAFQYAEEVFGDPASYLKIGFSFPLPMNKIREFAA